MINLTELQPYEQELTSLLQERAGAIVVHDPPPMPVPKRPLSITPERDRDRSRQNRHNSDRRKFWVAIAAAVALLAGAGWVVFNGAGIPTSVEVADGGQGDSADVFPEPVIRPVFDSDELAIANPTSAAETKALLESLAAEQWAIERPIIVVTAAEWCPHCLTDLPELIPELHHVVWNDGPVAILGVSAAGDQIWDQTNWPFQVLELAGDRGQVHDLLPDGLDHYPAVAVWTADGLVGESSSADGVTLESLQTIVASVPIPN